MLFLNTRPQDRAARLTQQLAVAGVDVIELALLELVEQPHSESLTDLYQQLKQAQVIVVVSPTAAHIGMRYLACAGLCLKDLSHIHWIAVGTATEQALAEFGIQSFVPDVETSEGMLTLPILKNLAVGSTLAFWRGEGGRLFMMEHFQKLNIQTLNFVLYMRQCPSSSASILRHHIEQLCATSIFTVLISSEASWLNWLRLIEAYPQLLEKAYYLTLGSRLTALVLSYKSERKLQFGLVEIENLQKETILQHLDDIQGKL